MSTYIRTDMSCIVTHTFRDVYVCVNKKTSPGYYPWQRQTYTCTSMKLKETQMCVKNFYNESCNNCRWRWNSKPPVLDFWQNSPLSLSWPIFDYDTCSSHCRQATLFLLVSVLGKVLGMPLKCLRCLPEHHFWKWRCGHTAAACRQVCIQAPVPAKENDSCDLWQGWALSRQPAFLMWPQLNNFWIINVSNSL